MIITNIRNLRDPFILLEDGVYYAYGTGVVDDWENTRWTCYKNTSGRLDGEWVKLDKEIVCEPHGAVKNRWAPEVHKYNGSYYMFTTYYSSLTNHRGCTILKSDSPEGPFIEITNGHITPKDWDAIDGTFYVDEEGQPWMVFVHEWTCTDDGIGRMAAAKLSEDLTRFISEPVELFRADDPKWSVGNQVTDGCFIYTTKDGNLLMLWSNFDKDGYAVGFAKSKNGKIDGEWIQEERLLFSKSKYGDCDGGHGMIFTDTDGQMYLCIHSPNSENERTVFIPVYEKDGTLYS